MKKLHKLGDELLSSELLYLIMHLIDQWFMAWDFTGAGMPAGETRYNCEAECIDYLNDKGYVQIIKGEWPKTKRLTFIFTEKGKQFLAGDM